MTKYSSFNQQQLITESWRAFLIEQEQTQPQQPQQLQNQQNNQNPVKQPNILQLVTASNTKLKVTQPGPSNKTKEQLNNQQNINNLKTLLNKKDYKGFLEAFTKILNTDPNSGDREEVINNANLLFNKGRTYNFKKSDNPKTYTRKAQINEKQYGPIASTIEGGFSLAKKGLLNLGDGDIEAGLKKFVGASATMVLSSMIISNVVNMLQKADPTDLQDTLQLIDHLKNSLSISNPAQLVKMFQTVQTAKGISESSLYDDAHLDDGTLVCPQCLQELLENDTGILQEAKYQGKTVTLNKPMKGDVKKSKVYVKNEKGNVVKVNFGDKNMKIKKNIPARRKSFRARHNCENPGPKTKARYWSCKAW